MGIKGGSMEIDIDAELVIASGIFVLLFWYLVIYLLGYWTWGSFTWWREDSPDPLEPEVTEEAPKKQADKSVHWPVKCSHGKAYTEYCEPCGRINGWV